MLAQLVVLILTQWQASQDSDGFWRFRNVATGLYLGQDTGKLAINTSVVGTSFEFPWEVEEVNADKHHFRLYVPNTKQVLDADTECEFPGVKLHSLK
ncbi:hypothetical protein H1R20_g1238, partial [Candolleomyces eurysporus]